MQSAEFARTAEPAFEMAYASRYSLCAEEKLPLNVCLPLAGGSSKPGASFDLERPFQFRPGATFGGFQWVTTCPGPSFGMAIGSWVGAL